MRVVPINEVEWVHHENAHRGGGLMFKNLLLGEEGSPENYWLTLAKGDGSFHSPRHRHNFDQFRISIEGRTSIDPKKYLEPGEIGYFPEGTSYGPQQDTSENLTLVLQFGGMSGNGFPSRAQVRRAQNELVAIGEFEGGIFRRKTGDGKKNQDGFEAVWEHVMGRRLEYPEPRFDNPVFMNYRNFSWRPTDQRGVSRKTLGVFTERETRLEMVKIEQDAEWSSAAEDTIGLSFVMSGDGTCGGKGYSQYTSIETLAGERAAFRASRDTEILRMVLPMLHLDRRQADRRMPAHAAE
jgi:hypothetical protein